MDAKAVVDQSGIGCEPASAASVAGTRKLVAKGVIQPGQTVVSILTGNLLKDPGATVAYHTGDWPDARLANSPIKIEANLATVAKAIEKML
jgi:threonine synthase